MSTSAIDNLGPHLLGRAVGEPDERDFRLTPFLLDPADPLAAALQALEKSHAAKATKDWAAIATPRLLLPTPPGPTPTPAPTPSPQPSGAVLWTNPRKTLDQGQTPHCEGFGWAQYGNTSPVNDLFANSDGDAIYYECKAIDGEPGQEDGSSTRSGAKAMKARGRVGAYAFAQSVDEVIAWILAKGPIVFGTDWTNDMFNPDGNGFVAPTGGVAGGHCYVGVGYDPALDVITFLNSWGPGWALAGLFKMHAADFRSLYASNGDACAAVELAIAA